MNGLIVSATIWRMTPWPLLAIGAVSASLAQQGIAQHNMREVLLWGAVLLVAGMVLGGVILGLRRRVLPKEEHAEQIWTLQDLRRMREAGDLSDEEFETLRSRVVAQMGGSAGGDEPRTGHPDRRWQA